MNAIIPTAARAAVGSVRVATAGLTEAEIDEVLAVTAGTAETKLRMVLKTGCQLASCFLFSNSHPPKLFRLFPCAASGDYYSGLVKIIKIH